MPPPWEIDPNEDPYHGDGPASPDKYNIGAPPDLNSSEIGKTLYPKLNDLAAKQKLAGTTNRPVPLEHVLTFDEGLASLKDVADDIAQNHHNTWGDIGSAIQAATDDLQRAVGKYRSDITGATADAMFEKVSGAIPYLTSLAEAVTRMDPLVDSFSRDMKETRDWFNDMQGQRQANIDKVKEVLSATHPPGSESYLDRDRALAALAVSQVNEQYNNEAKRTIQGFYNPPIDWVSHNHPDMTATPPQVGNPGSGPVPTSSPGGMGSPGGSVPGGPSRMQTPAAVKQFQGTGTPERAQPEGSSQSDPTQAASDAAKGAADAAGQAGQQAQSALGQAGDAAKQALDQASQAAQQRGSGQLPEGVLGLGPRPGGPSVPKVGVGGAGGGVGGQQSAALPKMTTAPTSASSPSTAATGSRSGLSSSAGSSGAGGAPAAGHRGGEGGDKTHRVNKTLRTTKNGEEVIDEPDAMVAVVGGERQSAPEPSKSTKPGTS